ncbi:hypothetical protein GCM10027290_56340 [Micromonospora sonneratiae]|uniref:Integral membrane protein n=1 Tax=Micromonospora sonneratiae TaxID=1184706 RepID=A0ABW3YRC5_9ACTN
MSHPPSKLERRYQRLLWAYPTNYRAERGPEIVGTYLDLAGPGRRWPSLADAADLLGGGLRQRLRAAGALGLLTGVRTAATLALTTATALAAVWFVLVEAKPEHELFYSFGPFHSLGAVVWLGWIVASVLVATLPAPWPRIAVTVAIVLTMAVAPASALTGYPRPALYILLPQVALGVVALARPDHAGPWHRFAPLGGTASATAISMVTGLSAANYGWSSGSIVGGAAFALIIWAGVLTFGYLMRGDSRGLWAALVLLTPVSLLMVRPLAPYHQSEGSPSWLELAGSAVILTVGSVAVLLLAVVLHDRLRRVLLPTAPSHCPTCGRSGGQHPSAR